MVHRKGQCAGADAAGKESKDMKNWVLFLFFRQHPQCATDLPA
jgi:hypothetical protein